ncbi:MAG: tRNA (N6-threonylcarbamoyladenosine(37)-N6)-methyltransferase TrmO [Symploca sp. SIO1A3]|nr:tRNA (N6-threonylcarbamoyladenosine(37)-N6)-methyltransferase TrmO [Symploca sp. SIO1A3]
MFSRPPDDLPIYLSPVGIARTPYKSRSDCPGGGYGMQALSTIEIFPSFTSAISGLIPGIRIFVLWWCHLANRKVLKQPPTKGGDPLGVFAMRSPERPNPIALSPSEIVEVTGDSLIVRGLDCVDGSLVLDIKLAILANDGQWV